MPGELLNPRVIERGHLGKRFPDQHPVSLERYLAWCELNHSSPNRVFGIKLLFEDICYLGSFPAVQKLLRSAVVLILRRRSKARQAVSYYFARQTGRWVASDPGICEDRQVQYDFKALLDIYSMLVSQEANWLSLMSSLGIVFREFTHEELLKDPGSVLRYLERELGIDGLPEVPPRTDLVPQSNSFNEEFVQRFLEDLNPVMPAGAGVTYEGSAFQP